MNVLWVTNIALPEYNQLIGEKTIPFGGWLVNSSNKLRKVDNINLSVAFPVNNVPESRVIIGEKIKYYPFEKIELNKKTDQKFYNEIIYILNQVKPDLVHLHGSEFRHTYEIIKICKEMDIKTVISIQGLVSKIANHMRADLPSSVYYGKTFREIIKNDNVLNRAENYKKRGEYEVKALKLSQKVIGRTTWDRAVTRTIDKDIEYFHCNESLRPFFYENKWDINECHRHTVFISQAGQSLKGFHYMVEATKYLVKKYPNIKIKVAGENIINTSTFKKKISISSYGKYIKKLIKEYDLKKNIEFLGILDEERMGNEYLKSHIFVMPSAIENSPNSLGEAMLLGLPSVSSYVGGIPDMITHGKEGFLYQADAPYMLAYYIDKIFNNDILAIKFSKEARRKAGDTHNIGKNINDLIKIYNQILENSL